MDRLVLLCTLVGAATVGALRTRVECDEVNGDFYDYSATLLNGTHVDFSDYRGKVVLVVNVATYWGLTTVSYHQMNALIEMYEGQDFYILGFPSNNFELQEPGANYDEIMNGIRYVRPGDDYVPKFPLFEKIDVNGDNEHELYTFLKSSCDWTQSTFDPVDSLYYAPLKIGDIVWNFEKFLIGRDGKPYSRTHPSMVTVNAMTTDIDYLLAQSAP